MKTKWINLMLLMPLITCLMKPGLALPAYDCKNGAEKIFSVSSSRLADCDFEAFRNDKTLEHQLTNGTRNIIEVIRYEYKLLRMNECILKKQLLEQALEVALLDPNKFAFDLMEQPGYMGTADGKTIHVWKCASVKLDDDDGKMSGILSEWGCDIIKNLSQFMYCIGGIISFFVTIFIIARLIKNSIVCGYTERSVYQGFLYLIKGIFKLPDEYLDILLKLIGRETP